MPDDRAIYYSAFERGLAQLINQHSMDQLCNTPDFILASFLMETMLAFSRKVDDRDKWWGVHHVIGQPKQQQEGNWFKDCMSIPQVLKKFASMDVELMTAESIDAVEDAAINRIADFT